MIEQDVLDKNPHVQWDDIAELKDVCFVVESGLIYAQ
jgi:uncharacterized protein with HEPN domain